MNRSFHLTSARVELPNSLEEVNDYLSERGHTDGLPVIPPTEDRVVAMANSVHRDPQEVIATVPPAQGQATVEKIAINAVMAGCRPEYMAVVLAAVEAICEDKVNLQGLQATTNPVGPLIIINGPIRHQLNINSGAGAFGPGWRANASIGRAIRLTLLNIGGALPGPVDKATQGYPGKYTFCFGENEEDNPWAPLHVERGFAREESTVTVIGAQGTSNMLVGTPQHGSDLVRSLALGMINVGCNNFVLGQQGEPLLALCPQHASILARDGYTKKSIKEYLWQNVRVPVDWLPSHNRQTNISTRVISQGMAHIASTPDQFMLVVVGGEGGLHSTFIPTFGDTWSVTRVIANSSKG